MIRYPFFFLPSCFQSKMALTFHFQIPIIRKYIRKISPYIKNKNVDGDSRSQRNGQRAGEGGNLVKVAGIEYHSGVSG